MMSEKSSFSNHMQRELTRRRLGPEALCLLCQLLCHLVFPWLMFVALDTKAEEFSYTAGYLLREKQELVSSLFGVRSFIPLVVGILAVVMTVQGFAWLDNRVEIDFYESQPIRRRSRFFGIAFHSFWTAALIHAVCLLSGLLLSFAEGALTKPLLLEALYAYFRMQVLYLGISGIAMIAMMFCGNVIIALLATAALLAYEAAFRILQEGMADWFYRTRFSFGAEEAGLWFSPVYYFIHGIGRTGGIYLDAPREVLTENGFRQIVSDGLPDDLRGLVLAAVCILFAYFCFTRRKNEAAGQAVVFRPVQVIVKLLFGMFMGTTVGLIVYGIMRESHTASATAAVYFGIVLGAFLMAAIMEIIWQFNFRAAFRHAPELLLAVLSAAGLFSWYRFDLGGYDRYVPKEGTVREVRFLRNSMEDQVTEEPVVLRGGEVFFKGQGFTEPEDILAAERLALLGQQELHRIGGDYDAMQNCNNMVVVYTLNSGRQEARRLSLPGALDPERTADFDRLAGSDVYKDASYQLTGYPFRPSAAMFSDFRYDTDADSRRGDSGDAAGDRLRKAYLDWIFGQHDKDGFDAVQGGTVSSDTPESGITDPDLQKEAERRAAFLRTFAEAYRQDLRMYDYSFARTHQAIGAVRIEGVIVPEDEIRKAGEQAEWIYAELKRFTVSPEYPFRGADTMDACRNCLAVYSLTYEVYPE